MGVPTIEGLDLERIMDLHAEIMVIEELIRVSCNIDTLDDEKKSKTLWNSESGKRIENKDYLKDY